MKLLKLKLFSPFRGLTEGFEINFRNDNYFESDKYEPICLVGLNGSGKSNTLEVLTEIFYYLELKTIVEGKEKKAFDERYKNIAFEMQYSISKSKWLYANSRRTERELTDEVTKLDGQVIIECIKQKNEELVISAISFSNRKWRYKINEKDWKEVLPNNVVGYSSGQNELISNPFIKLDYYYFDEFLKSTSDKNLSSNTDLNRMFFMDYQSNELVILANYLFQDSEQKSWKDEKEFNTKLKIKNLHSFSLKFQFKDYRNNYVELPSILNLGIDKLKRCATTYNDNELTVKDKKNRVIELGFYTDETIRSLFREVFKSSFELFKLLYLLRLMNIHCIKTTSRNNIKNAPRNTNLSDLIPKPATEDLVFKIEEIRFIKDKSNDAVSYKNLSDGEHQLLHVIGTLRLMQESDVLFLLDEPETHFNPEWRAKMINLIMANNQVAEKEQDHFITSHSPFIISDCKPNNVYIFNRDRNGKLKVETAFQKRLNTFGTSVNILTEEVFNKNESQGDYSLEVLNEIKNRKFKNLEEIQKAKEDSRILGDSVEKTLLFRTLLIKEEELKKGYND